MQNLTGLFWRLSIIKDSSCYFQPLFANNIFVTSKRKLIYLMIFFCTRYTPVANDSTLPPLPKTPNWTLSSLAIIALDIIIPFLNL